MKRSISLCAAVLLAVGLLVASPLKGSVVHPQVASASNFPYDCNWTIEKNHRGDQAKFWSNYNHNWDYLNVVVITWVGVYTPGESFNCVPRKEYEIEQWTSYNTPGTYWTSGRAWVCGNFWGNFPGVWSSVNWGPADLGGIYYPPGCGRQADDFSSDGHIGSSAFYGDYGEYARAYADQG